MALNIRRIAVNMPRLLLTTQSAAQSAAQSVRTMTYVPMLIYMPIYKNVTPDTRSERDKQDAITYNQKYDFRTNPLFGCNPEHINDAINHTRQQEQTPNDFISPKVRLIINSLAATNNDIYKYTDPDLDLQTRVELTQKFGLNTITLSEQRKVKFYMDLIGTATEREYQQVAKLLNNREKLMDDIKYDTTKYWLITGITALGYGWILYESSFYQMSPGIGISTFIYLLTKVFMMQYWSWIFPLGSSICAIDTSKKETKYAELYTEYTTRNYLAKYQHKLHMLNDLRAVFDKPLNPTS